MASLLRLAILVLLAWLAWRMVRRWLDGHGKKSRPSSRAAEPVERMVRCHHCRLHLPQREALRDGQHWYCSEAHRLADRERRSG